MTATCPATEPHARSYDTTQPHTHACQGRAGRNCWLVVALDPTGPAVYALDVRVCTAIKSLQLHAIMQSAARV